jgi:hypothetical protein
MKSSLRVGILLCGAFVFLASRAEAGVSFVQVTDLHLFGKDNRTENEKAFRECVEEINRRELDGAEFKFVVVTGDLGVEDLVSDSIEGKPRSVHPAAAADRVRGAGEFAKMVEACAVKKWLFLPGNNDLIDEAPSSLEHYTDFIKIVRDQLKEKGFEIIDLTPSEKIDDSGIYREGPYTFVGFNNASFKSNNKSANAKDPVWIKSHHDAIDEVSKRIKAAKNAYVFYHIPEVDDPYHAQLEAKDDQKRQDWFNERGVAASPFKYSAWTVPDDVRKDWEKIVAAEQVKGLFAGHFHDWRRSTYRNYLWLVTTAYSSGTLLKLHICPPVAEKNQPDPNAQARGFQTIQLDDAGKPSVDIVWYNNSLFSTDPPPRGSGPLLEKTIALSVDPATHTASAAFQLFNGTREPMKVALNASDFISTTTKRSIGGRVTFAGPGQTAGQQLYEVTVPVGAAIPVRVDAAALWEAGESIAQILDHGVAVGTLRAMKSRPAFSVKLAGEKPEVHFVENERQRIGLHNDDAMTYRAMAQIAFGNLLSEPVSVDLPPGGDAFFEIQLPPDWFPFSSAMKRQIVDGEVILALDTPGALSAPDLPRRRIPFKGSLNLLGPFWQGFWSYVFIIVFLTAGGVVSLVMSNYFPNQSRQRALADQLDDVKRDIDGLPSGMDSELRVLLRVECHRLRRRLMKAWMLSAEAPALLDNIAARISSLRKKTELADVLYKLKEKLAPFLPPAKDNIKLIVTTATQTEELLRASHVIDENLVSYSGQIEKALHDLAAETPGTVTPSTQLPRASEEIRAEFASRPLNMVVHPTFIDAYEVVTLTVEFGDGKPPPAEVICHWDCGDGFAEVGWKIFHYYAAARIDISVTATFFLQGQPVLAEGNAKEIKKKITVRHQPSAGPGRHNRAEYARLGMALGVALIGLLATAQEQLAKLDLFSAIVAVFLLGFTANAVKDILTPKQPKADSKA